MCQGSGNDPPRCGDVMCWAGVRDHGLQPSPCLGLSILLDSFSSSAQGEASSAAPSDRREDRGMITTFSPLVKIWLPKKTQTLSERKKMKAKPYTRTQRNTAWAWFPLIIIYGLPKLPTSPVFLCSIKKILKCLFFPNHQTKWCHAVPEDTVLTVKNKTQESQ